MTYKRYWVQGDYENFDENKGFKVYLKTNNLEKAINKMNNSKHYVFIWDCNERKTIDANYDCKIMSIK